MSTATLLTDYLVDALRLKVRLESRKGTENAADVEVAAHEVEAILHDWERKRASAPSVARPERPAKAGKEGA